MDWKALKEEGASHFRAGEFEKAIECYTKALKDDGCVPERHKIFTNRALCKFKMGNCEGSYDDSLLVLVHEPSWVKSYIYAAWALREQGKSPEAAKHLLDGLAHVTQEDKKVILDEFDSLPKDAILDSSILCVLIRPFELDMEAPPGTKFNPPSGFCSVHPVSHRFIDHIVKDVSPEGRGDASPWRLSATHLESSGTTYFMFTMKEQWGPLNHVAPWFHRVRIDSQFRGNAWVTKLGPGGKFVDLTLSDWENALGQASLQMVSKYGVGVQLNRMASPCAHDRSPAMEWKSFGPSLLHRSISFPNLLTAPLVCTNCGQPATAECKGCHNVRYCSNKCRVAFLTEKGHLQKCGRSISTISRAQDLAQRIMLFLISTTPGYQVIQKCFRERKIPKGSPGAFMIAFDNFEEAEALMTRSVFSQEVRFVYVSEHMPDSLQKTIASIDPNSQLVFTVFFPFEKFYDYVIIPMPDY